MNACARLIRLHRRGAIFIAYGMTLLGLFYVGGGCLKKMIPSPMHNIKYDLQMEDILGPNASIVFEELASRHGNCPGLFPASLPSFLRGVHLFGDSCPLTFWETFQEDTMRQELIQVARDGFNTIILVIPWAGFQVDAYNRLYDPWLFERLIEVLDLVREAGLYSIARIGYTHNLRPDNTPMSEQRCLFTLLESEDAFSAWSEYIRSLQHIFSCYKTHVFNFISWEDFFCGVDMMNLPEDLRNQYGEKTHFGKKIPVNDGTIPTAQVEAWYEYISSIWVKLLDFGQREIPNLTMEIRVDSEPVFSAQGNITWHGYNDAGRIPANARAGTYFSPHFAQDNKGLAIPAESAIEKLSYMLTEVVGRRFGLKKTFLEQFNFVDNTPGTMSSSNYMSDPEVTRFLSLSAPVLEKWTGGYALWAYRNYRETHLYNGNFFRGMAGWNVSNGSVRRYGVFTRLQGPLTLTSHQVLLADSRCDGLGNLRYVSFESSIASFCDANEEHMFVCLNKQCVNHSPTSITKESCYTFESNGSSQFRLSFKVITNCPVIIRRVKLWCHEQDLKVYHVDGSPGVHLGSIQKLNAQLML